jgi:hypothetical protein
MPVSVLALSPWGVQQQINYIPFLPKEPVKHIFDYCCICTNYNTAKYDHLMLLRLRLMLLAFLMTKKLLPLSRAVFRTNPGKPYRME